MSIDFLCMNGVSVLMVVLLFVCVCVCLRFISISNTLNGEMCARAHPPEKRDPSKKKEPTELNGIGSHANTQHTDTDKNRLIHFIFKLK